MLCKTVLTFFNQWEGRSITQRVYSRKESSLQEIGARTKSKVKKRDNYGLWPFYREEWRHCLDIWDTFGPFLKKCKKFVLYMNYNAHYVYFCTGWLQIYRTVDVMLVRHAALRLCTKFGEDRPLGGAKVFGGPISKQREWLRTMMLRPCARVVVP